MQASAKIVLPPPVTAPRVPRYFRCPATLPIASLGQRLRPATPVATARDSRPDVLPLQSAPRCDAQFLNSEQGILPGERYPVTVDSAYGPVFGNASNTNAGWRHAAFLFRDAKPKAAEKACGGVAPGRSKAKPPR